MKTENENLSFLLDDFTNDGKDNSVRELIDDVNLQYQARRYRMIGETMRGELPTGIKLDFHSDVMSQIHQEDPPEVAQANGQTEKSAGTGWFGFGWLKPLSGMAVALAVAVVTITTWQSVSIDSTNLDVANNSSESSQSSNQEKKLENLINQGPIDVVTVSSNNNGMRWKKADNPDLQRKLNGYLINHTEYSNSVQGIIPQARVVGFDSQPEY